MSNKSCYPPSPPLEQLFSVMTDGSTLEAMASMLLTAPTQQDLPNSTSHNQTPSALPSAPYLNTLNHNQYHHQIPDTFYEEGQGDYDLFPFQDTSPNPGSISLTSSSANAVSNTTSTPPSSPGQLFFAALELITQEESS